MYRMELNSFQEFLADQQISWQSVKQNGDIFYCLEEAGEKLWLREYHYAAENLHQVGRWRATEVPPDKRWVVADMVMVAGRSKRNK